MHAIPEHSRRTFLYGSLAAAFAPPPKRPLIDAHVHVWKHSPEFPFAAGAEVPAGIDASAESLLVKMAASGVLRTVLIQVIHYKWDNRYLIEALRRYPNRFAGVCRVNPEDPDAPDHLSQHTQDGCRGVRLSPSDDARGDWIHSPLMRPLWQRCQELRVPMTLLLTTKRLPDVQWLVEQYPELIVVIDHMADCPVNDPSALSTLTGFARFPNVYVKISHMWSLSRQPFPYPDAASLVARVRDAFGSGRLMWGTDWPIKTELLSYKERIELYRNRMPFLNADEHQDILYRSAQKVWPFGL